MTSQSEKTKHACIDISIKHKLMYIVIHKQSYLKLNHELVIAELPFVLYQHFWSARCLNK